MEKKMSKMQRIKNKKKQQQNKLKNKQQQIPQQDNEMEFEDEWEDVYEDEIIQKPSQNDNIDFQEEDDDNVNAFLGTKKDLKQDQQLQMNNEAYKMFHSASTEWPCLSFDVLINNNGNFQMQDFSKPTQFQYPLEVFLVGGSQSEFKNQNFVYLMNFKDLSITQYDDDEDVEDSFEETDPQMNYVKIPLSSNTNRIKSLNNQNIIAIMNDSAQLQILNLQHNFEELSQMNNKGKPFITGKPNIINQFLLTQEGFGLNFSPLILGTLACGSQDGTITLFQASDQNLSSFVQNPQKIQFNQSSIEDIQFSPKEEHVMAVCGCDGIVRVMDLRTPFNNIQHMAIAAHNSDVNVISWNKLSQNLLASGGDDGFFKIWDLRYVGKEAISEVGWHQEPITALQWQPHDEWTIAVSSSDDRLSIWDLSVENDDQIQNQDIPEQLLFLHQGQEDLKDIKWHPQYKDVIMTTALDGYNIFHPSIEEEQPQQKQDLVLNQLTLFQYTLKIITKFCKLNMYIKFLQSNFSSQLKRRLNEQIPIVQKEIRSMLKNYGNEKVAEIKVDNILKGMKQLPVLYSPCSSLDPKEGIRFRGLTISQIQQQLPKQIDQPLPEAVLWLLLTGECPSPVELDNLQNYLIEDDIIPNSTIQLINNNARSQHPMTLLSMCVLDLQKYSVFYSNYSNQCMKKSEYWKATFEDSLKILKILPKIAGLIYTTKYNKLAVVAKYQDWGGRFGNFLGFEGDDMAELLRSYLSIHADHEGGNVSTHSAILSSSALCDPYLTLCNALNGLAGPLHGLSSQEALKFLLKIQDELENEGLHKKDLMDKNVQSFLKQFCSNWLKNEHVIHGYGHRRLQVIDPRYTHLQKLSQKIIPNQSLLKLANALENIIPPLLYDIYQQKSYPTVDAYSGALFYEMGLTEYEFYTTIFGVSRAIGCFSNTIWARAIGLPLERPGSMTLEQLKELLDQ